MAACGAFVTSSALRVVLRAWQHAAAAAARTSLLLSSSASSRRRLFSRRAVWAWGSVFGMSCVARRWASTGKHWRVRSGGCRGPTWAAGRSPRVAAAAAVATATNCCGSGAPGLSRSVSAAAASTTAASSTVRHRRLSPELLANRLLTSLVFVPAHRHRSRRRPNLAAAFACSTS